MLLVKFSRKESRKKNKSNSKANKNFNGRRRHEDSQTILQNGQPVAVMRLGLSSMAVVVAFMGVVIAFVNVCIYFYRRCIERDRLQRRKKRIWQIIIRKKIGKMNKKERKNLTVGKSRWTYANRLGSLLSCSFVPLVLVALLCMLVGVAGALPSFCVLKSTTTCEGLNHEMVQKKGRNKNYSS